MNLKTVTFTGADDTVAPADLVALSKKTRLNVEWAILFSQSKSGVERYPSLEWVEALPQSSGLNLAAHLCGKWADDAIKGEITFLREDSYKKLFNRIQLNLGKERLKQAVGNKSLMSAITACGKPVILGGDYSGVDSSFVKEGNFQVLFDASDGRGISTKVWPEPYDTKLTGYAGGLGPDNLREELRKISQIVGPQDFWIDMESSLRVNGKFSLAKCEEVLAIVEECQAQLV